MNTLRNKRDLAEVSLEYVRSGYYAIRDEYKIIPLSTSCKLTDPLRSIENIADYDYAYLNTRRMSKFTIKKQDSITFFHLDNQHPKRFNNLKLSTNKLQVIDQITGCKKYDQDHVNEIIQFADKELLEKGLIIVKKQPNEGRKICIKDVLANTFLNHPLKERREEFASAGFYALKNQPSHPDATECLHRGCILVEWGEKELPAEEHKREYPNCKYSDKTLTSEDTITPISIKSSNPNFKIWQVVNFLSCTHFYLTTTQSATKLSIAEIIDIAKTKDMRLIVQFAFETKNPIIMEEFGQEIKDYIVNNSSDYLGITAIDKILSAKSKLIEISKQDSIIKDLHDLLGESFIKDITNLHDLLDESFIKQIDKFLKYSLENIFIANDNNSNDEKEKLHAKLCDTLNEEFTKDKNDKKISLQEIINTGMIGSLVMKYKYNEHLDEKAKNYLSEILSIMTDIQSEIVNIIHSDYTFSFLPRSKFYKTIYPGIIADSKKLAQYLNMDCAPENFLIENADVFKRALINQEMHSKYPDKNTIKKIGIRRDNRDIHESEENTITKIIDCNIVSKNSNTTIKFKTATTSNYPGIIYSTNNNIDISKLLEELPESTSYKFKNQKFLELIFLEIAELNIFSYLKLKCNLGKSGISDLNVYAGLITQKDGAGLFLDDHIDGRYKIYENTVYVNSFSGFLDTSTLNVKT